ncbi:MAG TPA: PAS domain-containing sensor histidine kinase [Nitrospiraceae bacterium]|nr:PAS domain-containing sensor histidine kinase [Nitrospiraceae bacterium]
MKKSKNIKTKAELRSRAEKELRKRKAVLSMPPTEADSKKLIHELQVHQIELDMQNEELKLAKELAEARYERYIDLYDFAPVGYFTFDSSGIIREVNLTGSRLLGTERPRLVNKRFEFFITDEDRPVFRSFLGKVFERRGKESCEVTLKQSTFLTYMEATASPGGQECRAVLTDISERANADRAIRRLNEELEHKVSDLAAVNTELEAFSYSVSHDLRAPLHHISGFVHLLQKELIGRPDKKVHEHMAVIAAESKKMSKLIDDLLSFSHMANAKMKKRKVRLNPLVREVVQEIQDQMKERDIIWEIDELPDVDGDPSLLKLMIVNLLSNAVKYTRTRPQAEIRIGCKDGESEVICSVKDNGVGFNMEYVDRLFGVFQRLHTQDEFEGTGIGLANVRRIIARHGGRTWAEGEEGKGAIFYFTLPKAMKS